MVAAVGTAAFSGFELAMMRAESVTEFASAMRWAHVAVWVIVVSLAGFVKAYLHTGRTWLLWTVFVLRTFSLLLNFLTGQSLNYREITGLSKISFLGESVSVASATPNPWMLVGQLSLLALLYFVVDAAILAWRRGDRRRAFMVGGSVTLFVLVGTIEPALVFWGLLQWPITGSLFYVGIVIAMGYELSHDLSHTAGLAGDLHESEQSLAQAAEAANLGIWIRDLAQDEIWATNHWRNLFGFSNSEHLTFEKYLQRLHTDDRESVRLTFANAIRGGEIYEMEYRVVRTDAPMRWIVSRGRVEFNHANKAIRVRCVSIDVTRRKEAELELHSHRQQLAHMMRVASLGELSSALAHELNQPLTAILSNAQAAQRFLAQDKCDPGEIREILKDIVADDQRASEVIRRLRTLLKKGESHLEALDVNELVREVIKLMQRDLDSRAVAIVTDFSKRPLTVLGDRVQIQQVLINLILNAADAMMKTVMPTRTLTLRSCQIQNGFIQISVADTGCGIPAGDEDKIFDPYHTTKPLGLGLGLSLSRSIVVAHGGRLWAENRAEVGATFCFTLPEGKGETR